MAAFESQKKSARNLVLSIDSQLTPNDVFIDAKFTRRVRFDGAAVMELTQTRRSDKDMSGKGTEFATDGQLTSWDSKFNFKGDLNDWICGWLFAFLMGKDTVTGMGPYVHDIEWDETTTQAKMTNVYIEDTAAVKTKYPDMAMSDVTLTYAARGAVQFEANLMGTGRWSDGALASGPPALPQNNYLLNSDTVFSIGPVGSVASILGRFLSGTLKMASGVVNHTAPGGGLYGIFMRTGLRSFSLDATIAAKDTDDIRTLFINDTASALTIVTTSGSIILSISIPLFHMKATKLGVDGNMVIWQISLDQTTAFYNTTGPVEPISINLTNTVPAYLTGV